eukprot:11329679-Alexandrium_andersonii.AAC.1
MEKTCVWTCMYLRRPKQIDHSLRSHVQHHPNVEAVLFGWHIKVLAGKDGFGAGVAGRGGHGVR